MAIASTSCARTQSKYTPLVNCSAVERRLGKAELFLTKESVLTTCLEPADRVAPRTFPYNVNHLATKATIAQTMLHSFVDLVLKAYAVDERYTSEGDPFDSVGSGHGWRGLRVIASLAA